MADGIQCESCGTFTVVYLRDEPERVRLYRCAQCGETKRWCPRCEQGWVRHYRDERAGNDLYNCDECEATWSAVAVIGKDDSEHWRAFDESFRSYNLVRDFEAAI